MDATAVVVLVGLAGVIAAVAFNWYRASSWQTAVRELKALKAAVRAFPSPAAQRLVWAAVYPDLPYPTDPPKVGEPNPALILWQAMWDAKHHDIPDTLLKET